MPAHVAAGRRLGQAVGRDLLALRLRHEISLLLILGAPGEQRQAVEPGVHRHDHAQRRVDVFELLAGQAERDVVHPRAAVLRRHGDAEQAELGHLRQDASGRTRCARSSSWIRGATSRRAPLAHRLLEQALFVSEIEVHHGGHSDAVRRCAIAVGRTPRAIDSRQKAIGTYSGSAAVDAHACAAPEAKPGRRCRR